MTKTINKSAYRFFLCMKYILSNNVFSLSDITLHFKDKHKCILSVQTILKYIRSMKKSGFKFQKINNKTYKLIAHPFKIKISKANEKTLLDCLKLLEKYCVLKNYDYSTTIGKMMIFMGSSKLSQYKNKTTDKKFEKIAGYCSEKQRIYITYLFENEKIEKFVEPLDIIIQYGKIYLKCYDLIKKESVLINPENILKIEQTPQQNKFSFTGNHVTLCLDNTFSMNYTFKEYERIIRKDENYCYVESLYYDKELFFTNLMRYADKCKILAPEALQREFKQRILEVCEVYDI